MYHTIGEAIVNKGCAFMVLLRRLMHKDWHHPNLKVHTALVSVTVLHKVLSNLKSQRLSGRADVLPYSAYKDCMREKTRMPTAPYGARGERVTPIPGPGTLGPAYKLL